MRTNIPLTGLRKMVNLAGLTTVLVAVPALSSAKVSPTTWTQVSYTDSGRTTYVGSPCGGFTADHDGYFHCFFQVQDHFVVTGDETQEPSWHLELQNLCNNYWFETYDNDEYYLNGDQVTYRRDYYVQTTSQTFTDGTNNISRASDSKITIALYTTYYRPTGNPGGGGGA